MIPEKTKEKKNESEDSVEMSKNAQFRAIQPSPSILSFVEDNVMFFEPGQCSFCVIVGNGTSSITLYCCVGSC